MTVEEAIQTGLGHHRLGKLAEAENVYRQILAVQPNNADAIHLLGLIAHQVGKSDIGADMVGKAIAIAPHMPEFYSNYALILTTLGRFDEADRACRRALEIKPTFVDAYLNLSEVMRRKEKYPEALQCAQRALELEPNSPEACSYIGNVYKDSGNFTEGIFWLKKAVELRPNYTEALNNLGNAFTSVERYTEAEQVYREALRLQPDLAEAIHNLGTSLKNQHRIQEAIACFQKAIQLKPTLAEPHSELGDVLRGLRQMDQAVAHCRKAIALRPTFGDAWHNLAYCLQENGLLTEAIAGYDKAIELKRECGESYNNRGNCYKDLGLMKEAIASFRKAIEVKPRFSQAHSNLLYALLYPDNYTPEQISQEHREWDRLHAQPFRASIRPHENDRNPERRLRVGYVSPNFRDQVINYCFEPALRTHDRNNFQIFCYSDATTPDHITARLKAIGHEWRECAALQDQPLCDLIRQDRIDILVDLTGHIAYNRMLTFARKPAPVQVSYLGYQTTTGLSTMDYLLSDEYTNPPGTDEHLFAEKLVRLPGCFWCYLPQETPPINPLPAKTNGFVTFAFLNNFAKLTRPMMALWCQILKSVPNSKLFVLTREAVSSAGYLQSLLTENGVDPGRLMVSGPRPKAEYMKLFHQLDIALDPFPFNGHTTTHDCLWMGVPVVHMSGRTYHSRYGGSVLKAAGLEQWITNTPEEYLNLAIRLAGDVDALAALRPTLRDKVVNSVLMDASGFTGHLENAYRNMWRSWCEKTNAC